MPVKIGKGRVNTILATFPPNAEMICRNERTMTNSGNYGWRSVYYFQNKPVIAVVVDNVHSYSAIYDVRETPEQVGSCL